MFRKILAVSTLCLGLTALSVSPTVWSQTLSSTSTAVDSASSTATQKPLDAAVAPLHPAPNVEMMKAPALVKSATISAGDTAWMSMSTALVLLMAIPGLALFYAGMVRKKNALNTMAQTVAAACIVTVLWMVVGYSLAFTPGGPYIGGFDRVMLDGLAIIKATGELTVHHTAPTIPESVFLMFQLMFAIITPALITGAFAERMRFSALMLFIALWSLFVYVPVAHWVWEPGGWLARHGVLDYAGGTVVHINAGISGLVAAIVLGPRVGFGTQPMPPHNLVLTVIGAGLLWVGWFGFNGGSAGAADGRAGLALMTTHTAAAVGGLSWTAVEWLRRGTPSVLGLVSGVVAGLVAITPAAGYVTVSGAMAMGAASGMLCYVAATMFKTWLGYDDSLDVFGVHAVAGILGALLTGLFAVKEITGVASSVEIQLVGVLVTVGYSAVVTAVILWLVNLTVGLRVTKRDEAEGLDLAQHGEQVG